jgi:hypothetical protein
MIEINRLTKKLEMRLAAHSRLTRTKIKTESDSWESQLAWRLARMYEQRLNSESKGSSKTANKLEEDIKALLPLRTVTVTPVTLFGLAIRALQCFFMVYVYSGKFGNVWMHPMLITKPYLSLIQNTGGKSIRQSCTFFLILFTFKSNLKEVLKLLTS